VIPSSRTPEGSPNQCPICGAELRIEPSQPTRDAPCPACGHLLWFLTSDSPPPGLTWVGDIQSFRLRLLELLPELPDADRRVVELRLTGRRPAEIASELTVPERTVRRVLERVRRQATEGLQ
jgi:DNA-directed RNA polymerase specialized sigma24 family protein